MDKIEIVIVTGMSGAGKTTAMAAFENMAYRCIDNYPIELLGAFSEYLKDGGKIDTIERDEERIAEAKENIKKVGVEEKINIYEGDAVEILPTMNDKYDVVFIDAAKGKYPFFLEHALRMLKDDGIIFADNVLYKGYVMSDYNKHKQRTAVTHLRQYIKETTENPELETEILKVGDGLAITKKRIKK